MLVAAFALVSPLATYLAPRFPASAPTFPSDRMPHDNAKPAAQTFVATREEDVVDDYHGTAVRDPYRWLEEGDSPEVVTWTDRQNELTRSLLDALPGRVALHDRIRALLELGAVSPPQVHTVTAGVRRYFHTRRERGQNQPVLYVREGLYGDDRPLVDPATLGEGGGPPADATTALDWWYPSHDGALLAFGRSDDGSEESTLHVRDVTTGKDLPDRIPDTRHASIAWARDNKRFFYTRYPAAGSVSAGDEKYFCKVFEHVLGEDPSRDRVIFGEGRDKTDSPSVTISPDGRWLAVRVHEGYDKSEVFLLDLSQGAEARAIPVAVDAVALFEPIPMNDRLYLLTNAGAPRFRLVSVDYKNPEGIVGPAAWKEILPESADVLVDVQVIGKELVASYLHEASTRILRFTRDGSPKEPVLLPAMGTATVSGAWDNQELFVGFTSYVHPPSVMLVDLGKPVRLMPWDKAGAGFTPPKVKVSQLHARSKDGTLIPMFVVEKEGASRDGQSPTVLWGYGGFNLSYTPTFSASALTLVERGGVWVMASLRGGGELGEEWHRAGMLANKQNVFDDFVACAEALIEAKITSTGKLAAMGGSNGGLLVAAALTQRPDLFRAGLSLVPLTDMLRYQRFRVARFWIPEFGSSDDPEQFAWLYAYSPYHRVVDGTRYPAMLFTAGESDSRVDPMHARKMVARLQRAQGDNAAERPILLRIEKKAGHGQGKPISLLVDELTDELGFVFAQLGVVG